MRLKIPVKVFLLILFCTPMTAFFSDNLEKRVIRSKEYDIHLYVSLKEKTSSKNRMYYWYKTGDVHNSFGDSGGLLLHKEFIKYYKGNQIAEKGLFHYGLKVGAWKKWHPNGILMETTYWVDGRLNGPYYQYSDNGVLMTKGAFRKGSKAAKWINYSLNDTIWYRNGKAYNEHPRILKKREDSIQGKSSFFKKLFQKKDSIKTDTSRGLFKRIFSGSKHPMTKKGNYINTPPKKKKNKKTQN